MSEWDARYAEPQFAYGTEPNGFLASVIDRIPQGPVLCLAEGQGRNAVFLAQHGLAVLAMDQSPVGMERAAQLARDRGVALRTEVADLRDFVIEPGAWAGIVAIFAHLPPALRADVYRRVVAGLRPGGVFLLESYTPAQLALGTGGPKVPEMLVTLDTLRHELTGLSFDVAQEVERDVFEGHYHTGRAAVVQLVASRPPLPEPSR
jgi:hypothetical protein